MIKHVVALPLGFTAEFTWTDRAWRKFREAYNEARRSFLRDVATVIGGSALVMDIDGPLEVVKPGTRH